MAPILEQEGVVLYEEGLSGSTTLRNFRAPGRRSSYRKSWFAGSLIVTEIRLAGFAFRRPVLNLPREREHLAKLDCTLENDGSTLRIGFDAADFHDGWTGEIELKFSTDNAPRFLEHMRTSSSSRNAR